MLISIQLNHQLLLDRDEVNNVPPTWGLPSEVCTELIAPQEHPQGLLGIGGFPPQVPCTFKRLRRIR
jgi:hypothetical protein